MKLTNKTLRDLHEGDMFVFANDKGPIIDRQRWIVSGKSKWSSSGSAIRDVQKKGDRQRIGKRSNTEVILIQP